MELEDKNTYGLISPEIRCSLTAKFPNHIATEGTSLFGNCVRFLTLFTTAERECLPKAIAGCNILCELKEGEGEGAELMTSVSILEQVLSDVSSPLYQSSSFPLALIVCSTK